MRSMNFIALIFGLAGVLMSGFLVYEKYTAEEADNMQDIVAQIESIRQQTVLASRGEIEQTAAQLAETRVEVNRAVERIRDDVARIAELQVRLQRLADRTTAIEDERVRLNNQFQDLRAGVNVLSEGLVTIEERFESMSERVATQLPITNQGRHELVGAYRFESMPSERRIILSNLRNLPSSINVDEEIIDLGGLWTEDVTLEVMQEVLVKLSSSGLDAHLLIGQASPVDRLVWLEVHEEDSFTILHPSLDYVLWNNVETREKVPSMFRRAEFGVTYDGGTVQVYQLTK